MKNTLSPTTMFKLQQLFSNMDWTFMDDKDVRQSLYKRYCERLRVFEEDGQELFIELSHRFEQIFLTDYIEKFLMSFHTLDESVLKQKAKIIISPLINPFIESLPNNPKTERNKTKSAEFLFYMLSSHDLRWIDYSSKFEFCDTITEIKSNIKKEDDVLLILIDDFIGSGGTAVKCCKLIYDEVNRKKKRIDISDICIVSIAAMEHGVKHIYDETSIRCFSDMIRKKGITDYFEDNEIEHKKKIMRELEAKIYFPEECPNDYSLGFKESEALISFMNKTPNNTFPVYWYETKTKIAPFPRYKTFK